MKSFSKNERSTWTCALLSQNSFLNLNVTLPSTISCVWPTFSGQAPCSILRKWKQISTVSVSLFLPEARLRACSTWWWGAAWTNFQDNGLALLHEASTGAPSRPRRTRCSFCCPWFLLVSCTAGKKRAKKKHIKTCAKQESVFFFCSYVQWK